LCHFSGGGATLAEALATANRAGGIVLGKLGTATATATATATVTRAELFTS
jgi:bifunctional ADP-heptose synthase (sugar kinase/adenylyltransferase)